METTDMGEMKMKATSRTASGLHMVLGMKQLAVAILAMVALSGCGVGADEYWDGEKLVSRSGQALEQNPADAPELPGAGSPQTAPQAPGTAAPSPTRDPSTVALPQDPIPVKPGIQSPPMNDPGFDPHRDPTFDPRAAGFTPQPGVR